MNKNFIKIFLLFSFSYLGLNAQYYRMRFDHLSVTEGLSQSSVRSIAQDKHGFMWFATLDGLDKFDGYEIKTYYSGYQKGELPDNIINVTYATNDNENQLWIGTADHGICLYDAVFDKFVNFSKQKNNKTLINDHVTAIAGDSRVLWIGTENGLSKFDQIKNKWTSFDSKIPEFSDDNINCLIIDNFGCLWIGTEKGLFILDTTTLKFIEHKNFQKFDNKIINAFTKDVYGNIWIGTSAGIFYYDFETKKINTVEQLKSIDDTFITAIKFDFQNILWIGTNNGGLIRFDPSNKSVNTFVYNATDPNSITVNSILYIYEDSKHLLWIGTSLGGVEKWNRAAQELLVFRHNPYNPNSLSSSRVRSILQDKSGVIWIGTVDGGLNKWDIDLQKFIWTKYNPLDPQSIPENHIRSIFEDSQNRYWIGTDNNGLCIINPKTLKVIKFLKHSNTDTNSIASDRVWRIAEQKNGTIWFATYGGGVSKLERNKDFVFKTFKHSKSDNSSLSNNFCSTLFIDSKDRLWVGTNDGLNLYNPQTGGFLIFRNNFNDLTTISNNRIYSIIEDSDGNIWIGTKGGLNKYLDNGKFESFTVKSNDLSNNVIMGILEDSKKNLWLTTNRGLCKFNRISLKARTYDVKDGLQSNEFLVGSYLKTKEGMFIVGGINGFNAFYPEKIKNNPNIPSIVITDFMVSNETMATDTNISEKKYLLLNHKQNDLTFKFVSIDYILPEKNQYAYKLVGYDNKWVYSKFERIAKYTNLPPGHYVFQVKGSNNDLVWNQKGIQLAIYIKPALYQRIGFKIGVGGLIVFIFFFVAWLRMRILQRQKHFLQEEVKRQTKNITEKNEELQQQKEEIETQRDEIDEQRTIAISQRDLIARHQKDIEDSIIYAKNIQTAAMPVNKYLQLLFDEFFILFKPRDIVSGDFYWASLYEGKLIAVAADCTGHGVPGAFMSMLGISFLNKIVNEKGIIEADQILERLRSNVINALSQTVEGTSKDGMDISICVIDNKTNIVQYAGANNPLYIIHDGELEEIKAEKMPVAIYDYMKPFKKYEYKFKEGDLIYMLSDGYADQFGGPQSKKFKYANLKTLLLKIHTLPMNEQKEYLEHTLNRWMSFPDAYSKDDFHAQIDDIIIFGIRL